MDQYIGKLLDNRYEILQVIGNGGMAVVYKAICHRLNRNVAIKILRPDQMMDDDIRRRFHDEAQAVAMLSSPNIVSVYDVGQVDGADYIVMELIEGITLKEYMERRGGCLNWREALHFMVQIMQALRHAHSKGIVHRDIKPQNIMVLRDGSVKVADFGIARIMDSQKTVTTQAFGSVHYVSPEQAKGISVDTRSDIYSAGVVLYEMLTGRLPFDGDTPVSIAIQHINSVPALPRSLNPEIPVGMEQICKQSLCNRLELRYPDAQTVLRDLEEFRRNPNVVFPYSDPWEGQESGTTYVPAGYQDDGARTEPVPGRRGAVPQQASGSVPQDTVSRERIAEAQHKKKAKTIFVCAVVAVILVIFAIFMMLWNNFISNLLDNGQVYTVPSVKNMTVDEAKELIATQCGGNFKVVIAKREFSDSVDEGDIISQSPVANSETKSEITDIEVIISAGIQQADTVYMPSVVRQDNRSVEAKLKNDYGLEVVYGEPVFSSTIAEGLVVSSDPVDGTPLEEGQVVTLYVSKGPEVKVITMPDLMGMTADQAKDALEGAGLKLGACVTVEAGGTADHVIYQSVKPYHEVEPNTKIYLQISDGSISGGTGGESEGYDDLYDSGSQSGNNERIQPVYQITVSTPETEEKVIVTVQVNGEIVLNNSFDVDDGAVQTYYAGEINSIQVMINGVQTNDFDYKDVSLS